MGWVADRRLVVSEDGSRVLGPNEPQNGTLLAPAGRELTDAECRRWGLGPYAAKGPDPVAAAAPEPGAETRGVGVRTTRRRG